MTRVSYTQYYQSLVYAEYFRKFFKIHISYLEIMCNKGYTLSILLHGFTAKEDTYTHVISIHALASALHHNDCNPSLINN